MLFEELDVIHQWNVGIINISNCFDTSSIWWREDEMAPGFLKILIASMQQYLICIWCLFTCMHFICIY